MELNPFELEVSKPLSKGKGKGWRYESPHETYISLVETISYNAKWIIASRRTDYQGTAFFLGTDIRNPEIKYFVSTGYGSCSGCDALEACESDKDTKNLRDSLKRRVRKFNNIVEFAMWFSENYSYEYYDDSDALHFLQLIEDYFDLVIVMKKELKAGDSYFDEDDYEIDFLD